LLEQKVEHESVEEADAAVRDLFATRDRVRPKGLRYASTRVADSSTFVILVELDDGAEDPRLAISEFGRFLEQLENWVDGPPSSSSSRWSGRTTCSGRRIRSLQLAPHDRGSQSPAHRPARHGRPRGAAAANHCLPRNASTPGGQLTPSPSRAGTLQELRWHHRSGWRSGH
jgi:hypothetical protein